MMLYRWRVAMFNMAYYLTVWRGPWVWKITNEPCYFALHMGPLSLTIHGE